MRQGGQPEARDKGQQGHEDCTGVQVVAAPMRTTPHDLSYKVPLSAVFMVIGASLFAV